MKGQDLLQAMNGIDARYLAEAEAPLNKVSRRHHIIRALTVLAAAAIVPLSVGAAWHFTHPETVEWYFPASVEELESRELVVNESVENGNFRVTAETVLSDGYSGLVLLTIDPLRGSSKVDLDYGIHAELRDTQTGERIESSTSGFGYNKTIGDPNQPFEYDIALYGVDLSRTMELVVWGNNENLWHDLSIPVDFHQNVEAVPFLNGGKTVYLSPFEMFSFDAKIDCGRMQGIASSVTFVKTDGTRLPLSHDMDGDLAIRGSYYNDKQTPGSPEAYSVSFCDLLTPADIAEIIIDGKHFTKDGSAAADDPTPAQGTAAPAAFDVTVDEVLSDGFSGRVVFTTDADAQQVKAFLRYTDGEEIHPGGTGFGDIPEGDQRYLYEFTEESLDDARPIELVVTAGGAETAVPVDLTQNRESTAFTGSTGTVYLSPFEVYAYGVTFSVSPMDHSEVELVYANGTVRQVTFAADADLLASSSYCNHAGEGSACVTFYEELDPEAITEIIVDGEHFTR